jgi:hypothetical protein
MPDWRSRLPGQPMSAEEISDVVAWLASKRPPSLSQETANGNKRK